MTTIEQLIKNSPFRSTEYNNYDATTEEAQVWLTQNGLAIYGQGNLVLTGFEINDDYKSRRYIPQLSGVITIEELNEIKAKKENELKEKNNEESKKQERKNNFHKYVEGTKVKNIHTGLEYVIPATADKYAEFYKNNMMVPTPGGSTSVVNLDIID